MSNISEQYRKPLMSDETGKAIAAKLGGDGATEEVINISEQYRRPLMSDETGKAILAKIDGGGSGASALSELSDVTLTSPSDGQVLHYDGTEWINATPVAELPAVTSDDNGKILKVADGAWVKSSNVFIVSFSEDAQGTVTTDKTVLETLDAIESGKIVYANFNSVYEQRAYQSASYVPLAYVRHVTVYYGDDYRISFMFTSISDGINYLTDLEMNKSGDEADVFVIREVSYSTE